MATTTRPSPSAPSSTGDSCSRCGPTTSSRSTGEPITLGASVDTDGKVGCHGVPYRRYTSALDLLRDVIDRYPATFGLAVGAAEEG